MSFTCDTPYYSSPDLASVTVVWDNPIYGPIPFTASPTDTDTTYGPEIYAQAVAGDFGPVISYADSHWFSTIDNNPWDGGSTPIGLILLSPTGAQPPDSTQLVPPTPATGQTLQWDGAAWVLASFDITLPLADAKSSLINTTNAAASAAVDAEVGLYSVVQLITAPDVNALESQTYPGTTLGEYQTYVNGLTATTVAEINAATTVPDLYPINPATIPFTPTASGTISGSRTGNDFNDSYYVTFVSDTLIEDDTELFMPATSTVIPYILPTQFAGFSEAFGGGNYTVQIRQSSTGFVLAQYTCPAGPPDVVVSF